MNDQPLFFSIDPRAKKINDQVFAQNNQALYGLSPVKTHIFSYFKFFSSGKSQSLKSFEAEFGA